MKSNSPDLTHRSTHFDFGKNWADYAGLIDESRLSAAIESVERLVPDIKGKSFLDIGSGSGLFSVAALRLGAARVLAIDIDDNSVVTSRKVLAVHGDDDRWTVERRSVFELSPDTEGTFDVVYSWGVLHHTGDMWRALDAACKMVRPGGIFAFALYERTPFCGMWRLEKRAYMRAKPTTQKIVRKVFVALRRLARRMSGRPIAGMMERGMDLDHDAHDWLGGYPYESTNAEEVRAFMSARGFVRHLEAPVTIRAVGVLGSGCSEYVYRREAELL